MSMIIKLRAEKKSGLRELIFCKLTVTVGFSTCLIQATQSDSEQDPETKTAKCDSVI